MMSKQKKSKQTMIFIIIFIIGIIVGIFGRDLIQLLF